MTEIEVLLLEAGKWFGSMVFVRDFGARLHWFYLICFFALGSCLYIARRPDSTSMLSFLLPKHVLMCRSSLTDLTIYFFNGAIGTIINFATLIASTVMVAAGVNYILGFLFGVNSEQMTSGPIVKFMFGVAFLLLTDFSFFFAHYLHHKLPYLWSFHKTHHSAEVLTPITAYRFHPVELLLSGLVLAMCVGPLVGVYQYLFDAEFFSTSPTIFGIATLLWLLTANFRHSHIPLHYPKIISRWLVSPAMHTIHHSTDPRHFDKNFGLLFSFWDRLVGSWFLPEKNVELEYGLKNEHAFQSAIGCYLTPFKECFTRLKKLSARFTRPNSS